MLVVFRIAVGLVVTLVMFWLVTVVVASLVSPKGLSWRGTARLAPDVIVLLGRLSRDPGLSRPMRAMVWVLFAWMISPIDLMPDVIPVIGSADDLVLIYFLLRAVGRRAGTGKLEEHWPGSAEGLDLLRELIGVNPVGRSDDPATRTNGCISVSLPQSRMGRHS